MFDRILRWFRSPPEEKARAIPPDELERRLAALEAEADAADLAFRAVPFDRAHSLCLEAGDTRRALTYLGRAIDAYLEDEQLEAARAEARKLLRLHPRAVRTLCTITWLDLACGYMGDALLHLGEYVEASKRSGREELCREQILAMVRVVDEEQFRGTAAEGLKDLDFPQDALEIRSWVAEDGGPEGAGSHEELRARCLEAAVNSSPESRAD